MSLEIVHKEPLLVVALERTCFQNQKSKKKNGEIKMKTFVAFYAQQTKRGLVEKTMEVTALSRTRAFSIAHNRLPRHSRIGNVYLKTGALYQSIIKGEMVTYVPKSYC